MKPVETIINRLRVAMTDARQNESHFESWMILNEAICDAIDALALVNEVDQAQPAQHQCKFPLCQNEEYQQALAEHIKQELYTGEPAQRQRSVKPLTDEEIERIHDRYGGNMMNCARAIERAHGIKEK